MNSVPVNIYWSANDSAFIAEARELPGCTAHGDTHEQALKNIRDAIKLRLDTEKEGVVHGKDIDRRHVARKNPATGDRHRSR